MNIYMMICFQMAKIYSLLDKHRLQRFYKPFLDLGVVEERDFHDISDENLDNIGTLIH